MISVASLLNPATSETRNNRLSQTPRPAQSFALSYYRGPHPSRAVPPKQEMPKDDAAFANGKITGDVNFPPFEDLDESDLRETRKYQVEPLGAIRESPRHIPYNSEKKTFLEKTGRESFEVFQYTFKVPNDDKKYTVMWDYNIGLVRITPFFKCCGYSKTTPAKMLNMNIGLKEITHSITGGALAAQGYWMPYSCARAVCATFCSHISGALIPIFGPAFPSYCIPTTEPTYNHMTIDPSIIISATAEAQALRCQSTAASPSPSIMKPASGRRRELFQDVEKLAVHNDKSSLGRRMRLKRTFNGASDTDVSDTSVNSPDMYLYSPVTVTSSQSTSFKSVNGSIWTPSDSSMGSPQGSTLRRPRTALPSLLPDGTPPHILRHRSTLSCGASVAPSPWLSAIPRSVATSTTANGQENRYPAHNAIKPIRLPLPELDTAVDSSRTLSDVRCRDGAGWRKSKRPAADVDKYYDGEESSSPSRYGDGDGEFENSGSEKSTGSESCGSEKRAAWLLMNLSVRDGEFGTAAAPPTSPTLDVGVAAGFPTQSQAAPANQEMSTYPNRKNAEDAPRVKRRRAASL